jgi:hypothetical protein
LTRKLPSSIPYASLLTYSPRGNSEESQRSRNVCYGIKGGKGPYLTAAVERLVERWQTAGMKDFFGDGVVLVPAPRSSPLVAGALWPAELICQEIVRRGLAARVEPALQRLTAVPKSSFQKAGQRPDLDKHLESMSATPWLSDDRRIVVVDDVITIGRTLFAGCVLVQEAKPKADVRAFGLVRTMGLIPNIAQILDPAVGELRLFFGDVDRVP